MAECLIDTTPFYSLKSMVYMSMYDEEKQEEEDRTMRIDLEPE